MELLETYVCGHCRGLVRCASQPLDHLCSACRRRNERPASSRISAYSMLKNIRLARSRLREAMLASEVAFDAIEAEIALHYHADDAPTDCEPTDDVEPIDLGPPPEGSVAATRSNKT